MVCARNLHLVNVLTATLFIVPGLGLNQRASNDVCVWPFSINFNRYKNLVCHGMGPDQQPPVTGTKMKQNECISWKDDLAFASFVYQFLPYEHTHTPECHGKCTLEVYDDDNCGGRKKKGKKVKDPGAGLKAPIYVVEHAEKGKFGMCQHLWENRGRSIYLYCED
ncbi:hypothetical protein HII31_10103 [Pseudocercospora fuligena]|uniref:Uncharacterized protein n=1 Tax=Pseudocercospora fuligena TaxID=685502 RepID=A0A8H6RC75_9PEZI|nr:hypothetical protein HII31_10103 [Pseudocercospora fuligena]